MTEQGCANPIDFDVLVAYWLCEQQALDEPRIEEHVFECAYCARRLEELTALVYGLRAAVRNGATQGVVTQGLIEQMRQGGLRVREYRLAPGERVSCTIRAEDDAVVGRMQVPLTGVRRVDVLENLDLGDGRVRQSRVEDVPFDPLAGEVIYLPAAAVLRQRPAHTLRVVLVAVGDTGEQRLGEYTFAHSPS